MVTPLTASQFNKREGFTKSIIVPNASVLTLFSVPFTLMTAPVNSLIALIPLEIFARITAGTAYSGTHAMTIKYSGGATIGTLTDAGFLDQTVATGIYVDAFSATSTIVSPGTAITLSMGTADPTLGTSPITIKLKYKIHKVM